MDGITWPLFALSVAGASFLLWSCVYAWSSTTLNLNPSQVVLFFYGLLFSSYLSYLFYVNPYICPTEISKTSDEAGLLFAMGFVIHQLVHNDNQNFFSWIEYLSGIYFLFQVTRVLMSGVGAYHTLCGIFISTTCLVASIALMWVDNQTRSTAIYASARYLNFAFIAHQKLYMGLYLMFGRPSECCHEKS